MTDEVSVVRFGRWIFRNRGWLPIPVVLYALHETRPLGVTTGLGITMMFLGQSIRFWGVAHMGPGARDREANVRKLIYTGPYELSRNPLYIGNIIIFVGLGLATGGFKLAGLFLLMFVVYFNLMVRYEEYFLERRLGEIYRSYLNRVPRWLGESAPVHAATPRGTLDDRARMTLRLERTTMATILIVTGLIVFRSLTMG